MKLDNLSSIIKNKKKRLGRGYGSGKGGHTSSRGQKGQKSRSKVKSWFEGGQLPFIRRFPFQRGKGRFKSLKAEPIVINVGDLENLKVSQEITLEVLIKSGLVDAREARKRSVKILDGGSLSAKLVVKLPVSKAAQIKIESAGGSVVNIDKVGKTKVGENEKEIEEKIKRKVKGKVKRKGEVKSKEKVKVGEKIKS